MNFNNIPVEIIILICDYIFPISYPLVYDVKNKINKNQDDQMLTNNERNRPLKFYYDLLGTCKSFKYALKSNYFSDKIKFEKVRLCFHLESHIKPIVIRSAILKSITGHGNHNAILNVIKLKKIILVNIGMYVTGIVENSARVQTDWLYDKPDDNKYFVSRLKTKFNMNFMPKFNEMEICVTDKSITNKISDNIFNYSEIKMLIIKDNPNITTNVFKYLRNLEVLNITEDQFKIEHLNIMPITMKELNISFTSYVTKTGKRVPLKYCDCDHNYLIRIHENNFACISKKDVNCGVEGCSYIIDASNKIILKIKNLLKKTKINLQFALKINRSVYGVFIIDKIFSSLIRNSIYNVHSFTRYEDDD